MKTVIAYDLWVNGIHIHTTAGDLQVIETEDDIKRAVSGFEQDIRRTLIPKIRQARPTTGQVDKRQPNA